MDISLSGPFHRPKFLVESRFPDTDTKGVGLVDCQLAILEREALSVTDIGRVIIFVVVVIVIIIFFIFIAVIVIILPFTPR